MQLNNSLQTKLSSHCLALRQKLMNKIKLNNQQQKNPMIRNQSKGIKNLQLDCLARLVCLGMEQGCFPIWVQATKDLDSSQVQQAETFSLKKVKIQQKLANQLQAVSLEIRGLVSLISLQVESLHWSMANQREIKMTMKATAPSCKNNKIKKSILPKAQEIINIKSRTIYYSRVRQ